MSRITIKVKTPSFDDIHIKQCVTAKDVSHITQGGTPIVIKNSEINLLIKSLQEYKKLLRF